MTKLFSTLIFCILPLLVFSQHLYPEKYDNCKLSQFCLDCGEPKAMPPQNFSQQLISSLDAKNLKKVKGQIQIQVLIDSTGTPCLLSATNQTNVKSGKLNLQQAINNVQGWQPALKKNGAIRSSVSLLLVFAEGKLAVQRKNFDFTNNTNMKTVGTPNIEGTKAKKLSETWQVFTQANSDLPWDMSRAIANDADNNIWIGTDSGIVKIKDDKWQVFTCKNSPLKATAYNKNETMSVREMAVDKKNNKWFIMGWDVYKYDNKSWTIYDSLNSPINWARKIFVDPSDNVWFTSWKGVSKFDGKTWTVINTKNSELPTDKTLGIFVDKKSRLWVGTFEGNIMIDGNKTTKFTDAASPLSKAYISSMFEDKHGNTWFALYNEKGTDAGMYVLKTNGNWERINHRDSDLFSKNSINNFLLDEDKNELWVSLNNVGILKYNLTKKEWEIYTNQNSNVPSVNIEQITKDKNGAIWAATYAGVIRLNLN